MLQLYLFICVCVCVCIFLITVSCLQHKCLISSDFLFRKLIMFLIDLHLDLTMREKKSALWA